MTPKQAQAAPNDLKQQVNELRSQLELFQYQVGEIFKKLDRMEAKQDASIRQIDTLKYVSQHEFDSYQNEAKSSFALKAEVAPIRKLVYWMLGLVGAVLLALVGVFLTLAVNTK